MTKKCALSLIVLLALFIVPVHAAACTVFAATDGAVTLAGNNEDWFDDDAYIWFLPGEDGTYGRVFYGFENAHPQGGMNEKGLFFDWFAYGEDLAPLSGDKITYGDDLSDLLLETCASVEDALAFYETYNDPNLGYASILLADGTGDMAAITWDWEAGQPAVVRGGASLAIGVGERYIAPMLKKSGAVTEESFRGMLDTAHTSLTIYSTLCNLNTGTFTLYHRYDYDHSVVFDLKEELSKGRRAYYIPSLFPPKEIPPADQMTPRNMRDSFTNTVFLVLGGIFLLSVVFFAALFFRGRETLLPAAGVITGGFYLALGFYLSPRIFFAAKYGIAILGPFAASLPWIAGTVSLLFAAAVCIGWIRKRRTLAVRIISTLFSLVSLVCLVYLWTRFV